MDILYVLGKGSKRDNAELRYSLRSIAKFGQNVGRVFVVGYDPGFLSKEVTFIPCKDIYDAKHKNILHCIEVAVKKSDIADEFLLSSDDHYYIANTDFDNYPYFKKGMLPSVVPDDSNNKKYQQTLVDTRTLLLAAKLPYNNFSWHGNTHFDKKLFLKIQPLIDLSYRLPQGVEPTCLMLNALYAKKKFEVTTRKDVKVGAFDDMRQFNDQVADRECFSVYDKAFSCGVAQFLNDLFPKKCKYEQ